METNNNDNNDNNDYVIDKNFVKNFSMMCTSYQSSIGCTFCPCNKVCPPTKFSMNLFLNQSKKWMDLNLNNNNEKE